MKRITLIYILLLVGITGAWAQTRLMNTGNAAMSNRDRFGNQIDPNALPDNLNNDSTEIQSLPPKLYMWRVSEKLGEQIMIPVDTVTLNFQNSNLVEGMYGHYNYLGNLGSPRLSRIFFERGEQEPTIFMQPFSSFFIRPDQVKYTNSNIPYSNLTYYKAGNKINGEERFKSYFSTNVNKRFAFGFNIDYLYGRGLYANQSTAHFNAGIFASYIGEKYQLHATYNNFFLKMNENGGITDDQYITRPENMADGKKQYESSNIPVRFDGTSNRNHDFFVYLTHRYRMGFNKKNIKLTEKKTPTSPQRPSAATPSRPAAEGPATEQPTAPMPLPTGLMTDSLSRDSLMASLPDSLRQLQPASLMDTTVTYEFIPVTSIIHTVKVERSSHRFKASTEPGNTYAHTYYQTGMSNDTTVAFSVKNTVGLALLEGFNKYAKAGLTAYISHKYSRYDMMADTLGDRKLPVRYSEQEVFVGGELAKRQGKTLHYKVDGEVGIMDKATGQFRLHGEMDLNFRLWKDTVNFRARGHVTNTLPSFYMRHYHSNHFYWDNDNMDKEFRIRVEGELNVARWGTNLRAGVENLKNYTYFDQNALPAQHDGNIQVLSASLNQNFNLGIFHLDNTVTWQKTSNETVLPLPQLSLYHNLYLLTKVAKKVLTVQLGADVRYFSKYYAPAYTPAIQQFNLQSESDRVEIGGYPIVNVYANLQLKRTRIFVMMYHVNAGMGSRNYFLVPHYPINPRLLKIGVSWNFYD
ncbi:MAG: putative porin [Bacteroides sp.]|nr:putative porin [Bacteroides sp.]